MSELFSQPSQLDSSTQLIDKTGERQFLRFNLHSRTQLMLPIGQITEVLKIQLGQIVPIPQMPAWVMGVYNWRGDILWMVDLGHLIGLQPWYQTESIHSHHTAIVLSPNKEKKANNTEANINIGLVITKVEDIEMCQVADIQLPANFSVEERITSFLEGYWLKPEGEMIMLLDGKAIVAAMPNSFAN